MTEQSMTQTHLQPDAVAESPAPPVQPEHKNVDFAIPNGGGTSSTHGTGSAG